MSAPVVPFELQELVIDSVEDPDYPTRVATLGSCALTCRAWLPRSRRRLYFRLSFFHIRRKRWRTLLEVIRTSSELSKAIEVLELSRSTNYFADSQEPEDVRSEAILAILARMLPQLTSLALPGGDFCSFLARIPILAGFPTLTTLYLSNVTLTSLVAFRRLIVTAPTLRVLYVNDVTWTNTHNAPFTVNSRGLPCPPLTYLSWCPALSHNFREVTPQWHHQDCLALSNLILNSTVRGSLQYLVLRIDAANDKAALLPKAWIDLTSTMLNDDLGIRSSGLPNLSKLCYDFEVSRFGRQDWESMNTRITSSVHLLATLAFHARQLRKLVLSITYNGNFRLDANRAQSRETYFLDLDRADDVVGHYLRSLEAVSPDLERVLVDASRLTPLDTVVFVFQDQDYVARKRSIIRPFMVPLRSRMAAMFPKLHQRGILQVRFISQRSTYVGRIEWAEDGQGEYDRIPYVDTDSPFCSS